VNLKLIDSTLYVLDIL